jgi:competence protein ComFC
MGMNPIDHSLASSTQLRTLTKNRNMHVGWAALDWLFPPSCVNCQKAGVDFCDECKASLTIIEQSVCPLCGIPHQGPGLCVFCRQSPPAFDGVRSWALYEDALRKAIRGLKYYSRLSLSLPLGEMLADLFTQQDWQVDLVTAVPVSAKRRRERGYNQSLMIARVFYRLTNIPLKERALLRLRHTTSQVGLTLEQRIANATGAFAAQHALCAGKSVLIIDDVCTSSATLRACAQALKDAGALKVYGLTAARAGFMRKGQLALADDLPDVQ